MYSRVLLWNWNRQRLCGVDVCYKPVSWVPDILLVALGCRLDITQHGVPTPGENEDCLGEWEYFQGCDDQRDIQRGPLRMHSAMAPLD